MHEAASSASSASTATSAGGHRETVVLLHGFLGDRRDVEPLRVALSALFDCVTVDLAGHGDSAWLGPPGACLSALDALLDALDALRPPPRRLHLIGYSMGGRLALQLAARRPAQCASVVLLSSSPGIESAAAREDRAGRDKKLAARLRAMSVPQFVRWLRHEWYRAPLWGPLLAHPDAEAMLRRRAEGVRPADRAASVERESVGLQPSLWRWLEAPPMPVLFVAGGCDANYAPHARQLADGACAAPAAGGAAVRAALVPAAAHALLLQAPREVAALCTGFLLQQVAATPPPRSAIPRAVADGAGAGAMVIDERSLPCLLPYDVELTSPLPLARGAPLSSREGVLLLLEARGMAGGAATTVGAGDLCPLPHFHSEGLEEAVAQLRAVCSFLRGRSVPYELARLDGAMAAWLTEASPAPPGLMPSVRCAIEMALLHLLARGRGQSIAQLLADAAGEAAGVVRAQHSHVRLNALLARGEATDLEALGEREARGGEAAVGVAASAVRTWKVKVGGAEPAEEGRRVGRMLRGCSALGLRLRLDANQAWPYDAAAEFCAALRRAWEDGGPPSAEGEPAAEWPPSCLAFCEEPLRASLSASLPQLHTATGLRYALDESALTPAAELLACPASSGAGGGGGGKGGAGGGGGGGALAELRRLLASPGCAALVLKPTLLGGIEVSARLAEEARRLGKEVVLTSAFESGVAHAHIAIAAAVLGGPSVAHGLSTYGRLAADVLQPAFASAVRGDLVDVGLVQAALDATADACSQAARRGGGAVGGRDVPCSRVGSSRSRVSAE